MPVLEEYFHYYHVFYYDYLIIYQCLLTESVDNFIQLHNANSYV